MKKFVESDFSNRLRFFLVHIFAFVLVFFCSNHSIYAQTAPTPESRQETVALESNKPLERELKGSEAHSYIVRLEANQFLHLVVDQRGIDVVVTLFAPDGKKIAEIDSPNGTQGAEPIFYINETASGAFRVEVRSLEKTAAAGRYQVKIEELRVATANDKMRLAAESLRAEAAQLKLKGDEKSLRESAAKLIETIPAWQSLGDAKTEADALNETALVYFLLGDRKTAAGYMERALEPARKSGNTALEALILSNLGRTVNALGDNPKAIGFLERAIKLGEDHNHPVELSSALNFLGLVYNSMGEYDKAIDIYKRVISIAETEGKKHSGAEASKNPASVLADALTNTGNIHFVRGETRRAIELNTRALEISRSINYQSGEAVARVNLGVFYASLGEAQQAIDSYNEARNIFRLTGDKLSETYVISNLGALYYTLGDREKALAHYREALPLRRAAGDVAGEAFSLNYIGAVHESNGDYPKALESYHQSLPLFQKVGERRGEALTLTNIGKTHDKMGKTKEALEFFDRSLAILSAINDEFDRANALNAAGQVYLKLNENQKALDRLEESLKLRLALKDQSGEAETRYTIARAERQRNNLPAAISQMQTVLPIVENLRGKVLSKNLRASYVASVQQYFKFYIDLLMQMSRNQQQSAAEYDVLALQVNETARARSLLDLLVESQTDIRQGVDPKLLERERLVRELINSKLQRQSKLLTGRHTEKQLSEIARDINAAQIEHEQLEARIRQSSPRYAALAQAKPVTLETIQKELLDKDTILLEYSLGEERSFLWTVTPDSFKSYELPKQAEIEASAREFYELLTARNDEKQIAVPDDKSVRAARSDQKIGEAARRLSEMILAPAAAELKAKRLLIVADGALQYVPFAALKVGGAGSGGTQTDGQFLIETNEIVNLPSVSVLSVLRRDALQRKPAPLEIAVFADPVFSPDDARLSAGRNKTKPLSMDNATASRGVDASAGSTARNAPVDMTRALADINLGENGLRIPRLPFSRREANNILALVPTGRELSALDFKANLETIRSPQLANYRIVHFATHGILDSVHPELSGVVLSLVDENGKTQDGFLRLSEIFNLRLPAELVVLSACQTALGKEIRGEGLIGLTRGFMYAGAPRVVASLWKVDDAATAELMRIFYQKMLKENVRPAAALRSAQIELARHRRWQSPYYWAAFNIQGEWK